MRLDDPMRQESMASIYNDNNNNDSNECVAQVYKEHMDMARMATELLL